MPDFNGNTLIITLDSGATTVDVEADLYSEWKIWFKLGDNAKYPNAFTTTGGDPLSTGLDLGAYFFLNNTDGWKLKPPEEDITIRLVGNLVPESATLDAATPPDGAFTALIVGLQPVTQSIDTLLAQQLKALTRNNFLALK